MHLHQCQLLCRVNGRFFSCVLRGIAASEIHAATNSLVLVAQRNKVMTTKVCCSVLKPEFVDCNKDLFKVYHSIFSSWSGPYDSQREPGEREQGTSKITFSHNFPFPSTKWPTRFIPRMLDRNVTFFMQSMAIYYHLEWENKTYREWNKLLTY